MILRKLSLLIALTRWKEWIIGIGYVLFGFFLASRLQLDYISLVFMILVFLLSHSFGFAINDYFDAPFDLLKKSTGNLISNRRIKKYEAVIFCIFLAFFGLSIALLFLPMTSVFIIALLYVVFFVYSSPPLRLKEKYLLGFIVHGFFAPLIMAASYTITKPINIEIMLFSTSVFFLSILAGITQEVRDIDSDRKAGFKTAAVVLGYSNCLKLSRIILILSLLFFSITVILFLPIYFVILALGSLFYLSFLFGKPLQKEFYEGATASWKKGTIVLFVTGLLLMLFYIGLV